MAYAPGLLYYTLPGIEGAASMGLGMHDRFRSRRMVPTIVLVPGNSSTTLQAEKLLLSVCAQQVSDETAE